jgi:hypothetical protein
MTTSYNPRADWAREDRAAQQPVLGPLVDGDLCDISVGREYCHQLAVREAVDVDGTYRLLCAEHVAKLFPRTDAAQW